ncbi:hypothetical protein B0H13DRAFT_544129 [Mycena leptocephala]|nr:hypothetical protein B0H13DRAFT_544129 [Mycena leptocephala]
MYRTLLSHADPECTSIHGDSQRSSSSPLTRQAHVLQQTLSPCEGATPLSRHRAEKTTMKTRALPSSTALSGEVRSPTRYRAGHLAQLQDAYGRLVRAVACPVFCVYDAGGEEGSPSSHRRYGCTSIPGWPARDHRLHCATRMLLLLKLLTTSSPVRRRSPPHLTIAAREERTKTRRERRNLHGPALHVLLVDTLLVSSSASTPIPDLISSPAREYAPTSAQHRHVSAMLILRARSTHHYPDVLKIPPLQPVPSLVPLHSSVDIDPLLRVPIGGLPHFMPIRTSSG